MKPLSRHLLTTPMLIGIAALGHFTSVPAQTAQETTTVVPASPPAQTVQQTTTTSQPAPPPAIQQTTTTVQQPVAPPTTVQKTVVTTQPAPATIQETTTATTAEGSMGEFGSQSISINVTPGSPPVRYVSSGTTNYVDEAGNPVDPLSVKPGNPVIVHYKKVGDTLFASQVIVRKMPPPAPASVIKKKTKTTSTVVK